MIKRGVAFLTLIVLAVIVVGAVGYVFMFGVPFLSPSDDSTEGDSGDEPSPSGPTIQPRTICREKTNVWAGRYSFGWGNRNPINLGESLDEIVEEINESNMQQYSRGLNRGVYTTNTNSEFEYMQKIFISDNPPEQRLLLKHFKDTLYNAERPEIGIPINTQTKILNYELSFITPASSTLRQAGNEQIIENFVSTDIKIMEQLYQVQNAVIRDNKIRFTLYQPVTAEIIELIENEPSQINGQTANGLVADFEWNYQGSNQVEISRIMLKWTAQNKMFIAPEWRGQNTLVAMPGFEHLNFVSWGFFTPFQDLVHQSVGSYASLDTFYISSRVTRNNYYYYTRIPLLYGDRANKVILGAGENETNKLATPDSPIQTNVLFYSPDEPTNHGYFIASYKGGVYARGSESYILRFTNFREEFGVNYTDVQMLVVSFSGSSWTDVCLNKKTNESCSVGRVTLHLESVLSSPRSVLLTGGAFVTFDKFYTEEGLQIQLPIIRPSGETCQFKGCLRVGQDTNFTLWFREEDGDEVLASGEEFYSLIGYTRGSADPFRILEYSPELTFLLGVRSYFPYSSTYEEAYLVSPLATRIETQQSDFNLVEYHGAESFGDISLRITPEICSACNLELYYEVSLEEITETQVRLRISSELTMPNGQTTPLLMRGETYVLSDSSKVKINNIDFINRAVYITIIAPPEYALYNGWARVEEGESEIVSFCYCTWMGYYANQTGLVSWWPFDGNAEDIIDNNDGILQPDMEFVNGIVNDALRFDGVDDYVLVRDADNLDLTDFATIDAWVKPLSLMTNSEGIVFKRNNAGNGAVYGLFMAENGGVRFQVDTVSFGILATEATEPLPLDKWSHVAGVFSADNTKIEVYLNGQRQQTNAIPGFNVLQQNNKDVYIGAPLSTSSNNYFHGLIDEVEISNESLPITNIYQAFENGKCRPITPPTPVCGNGIVEQGEECDDGNRDPADQCSNECTLTFCGDSIVQLPNGGGRNQIVKYEECDTYIGQVTCSSLLGSGWSGFADCIHPPSEYMCEWNTRDCRYILPPPPHPAGCGNGVCEPGETCENCRIDCWRQLQCPIITGVCGQIGQPPCIE